MITKSYLDKRKFTFRQTEVFLQSAMTEIIATLQMNHSKPTNKCTGHVCYYLIDYVFFKNNQSGYMNPQSIVI